MKVLKPEDLPEELDSQTIDILVMMLHDFSKTYSESWVKIVKILRSRNQLGLVLEAYEKSSEKMRSEFDKVKTQSQRDRENKEIEKFNSKKTKFWGNMGEPTTPEEYKSKYGTYPPGYDKNGKKL
jgi:hypothetical protein